MNVSFGCSWWQKRTAVTHFEWCLIDVKFNRITPRLVRRNDCSSTDTNTHTRTMQ